MRNSVDISVAKHRDAVSSKLLLLHILQIMSVYLAQVHVNGRHFYIDL